MRVLQTARFRKAVKKLHKNQKQALDVAIKTIVADSTVGKMKTGNLAGIQVYKFKMVSQLTLLAYSVDNSLNTLILLAFGSHENFYPDL
jgi:mRNA-degrading endonuclease RelE of RelBE toxin-antitoxin system